MLRSRTLAAAALLALTAALQVGCGGDDGTSPAGPEPPGSQDRIGFRVYVADSADPMPVERLLWKGTASGPDVDSPLKTPVPWIGFLRPFRIEWEAESTTGAIVGYRYRASQDTSFGFLPVDALGAPVWGTVTSFSYQNGSGIVLQPAPSGPCADGPDCPGTRMWESGTHTLQVLALDTSGRVSDAAAGLLVFDINYPPETELVLDPFDPQQPCADDRVFPQYRAPAAGGGGVDVCSFADGDTVPDGAYVVMRLAGYDRTGETHAPDSLCCDARLDPAQPEVAFQGRLDFFATNDFGETQSFATGFNVADAADTLGFVVGPFDYTFTGRTKDEHGRVDPSPETFHLVAGFPPRLLDIRPAGGDSLLLRNPDQAGRWSGNRVDYTVETGVVRFWDGTAFRQNDAPGRVQVGGDVFRFGLTLSGRADPREASARVRSWAYEVSTERDPQNTVLDGEGFDNLQRFSSPSTFDTWTQTVEIFVPSLVWLRPDLFEPASPVADFADMGAFLRRRLGRVRVQARCKTTGSTSVYTYYPITVRPGGKGVIVRLGELGRPSAVSTADFVALLGIDADFDGTLDRVWPPDGLP